MLAALVIVFREVIEAGLIVGIVLAVTRGIPHRNLWVAAGIAAGIAGAVLVAAFAGTISQAVQGSGQELLNAGVLLVAVAMLAWHNAWMAGHGRQLAAELRSVGQAVATGERPTKILAVVVAVAVLREGSEVVLFLYGVLAAGVSGSATFFGGVLGLLGGALVAGLGYFGLIAIPTRHIFRVTTVLIALLAAGMAAQAMQFLRQSGWISVLGARVWDSSSLLSEHSVPGRVLHTLVGYMDRPTELQLGVYLATLLIMVLLAQFAGREQRAAAVRAQ